MATPTFIGPPPGPSAAGDAHQAAHALDEEVVAGAVAVGPGLAEAGDRAVDEPFVLLRQPRVVEPVPRERSDLVIFDEHIGARGQPAHQFLAFGTREIDGDRLLARLAQAKYAESPLRSSTQGGPQPRVSSPVPGRSTLITSAPRSASVWLAQGPARTRQDRGPAGATGRRSWAYIMRQSDTVGPPLCFGRVFPLGGAGVDRGSRDCGPGGGGGGLRSRRRHPCRSPRAPRAEERSRRRRARRRCGAHPAHAAPGDRSRHLHRQPHLPQVRAPRATSSGWWTAGAPDPGGPLHRSRPLRRGVPRRCHQARVRHLGARGRSSHGRRVLRVQPARRARRRGAGRDGPDPQRGHARGPGRGNWARVHRSAAQGHGWWWSSAAGPAGLATALRLKNAGLTFRVLEQGTLGGTVANYPRQKVVMTEAVELPSSGGFGRGGSARRSCSPPGSRRSRKASVRIEEGVRSSVSRARTAPSGCRPTRDTVDARKVVLATGREARRASSASPARAAQGHLPPDRRRSSTGARGAGGGRRRLGAGGRHPARGAGERQGEHLVSRRRASPSAARRTAKRIAELVCRAPGPRPDESRRSPSPAGRGACSRWPAHRWRCATTT